MERFKPVTLSLVDLLGEAVVEAICGARAALGGGPADDPRRLARRQVSFYPSETQAELAAMLPRVGDVVTPPLAKSAAGATTAGFNAASHSDAAPLSARGYFRIGEDGRLYLTAKSEHYHAPLGHDFAGYRLIDYARRLGIPNATHNNTRGHITRRLEAELIAAANAPTNGGPPGELDCVLNLETGSLAVEAGLKMMLSRFYRVQADRPTPPRDGLTPVFLVIGDAEGGLTGNYHGTTVLTQIMRGMWPQLRRGLDDAGLFKVVAVRPNCMEDLEATFAMYADGPQRLAGCFHELILMNYGGVRLQPRFVQRLYALCDQHGVPTLCDEIQSCLWAPRLFLFHEYGIRPTFVAVGKGFPGGEYPASRILFRSDYDDLPQFGALVTNGQEELASLAYLVTMCWARENAESTEAFGQHYRERLESLACDHGRHVAGVEGRGHLGALVFHEAEAAKRFAEHVAAGGVDISVQSYKASCPPVALTKLPLIADRAVVDLLVDRMANALKQLD